MKRFFIWLAIAALLIGSTGHPVLVYAATERMTIDQLEPKLTSALRSRLTSYTVEITGTKDQASLSQALDRTIKESFKVDPYAGYCLKSYGYKLKTTSGVTTVTFSFQYWNTASQVQEVNATVSEIIPTIIKPGMNDYQKEKAIHDWIVKNVVYNPKAKSESDYAALVSPYEVTSRGIALLAYRMFSAAGLHSYIVEGQVNGAEHIWNLVEIDGNFYHLDIALDNPVPDLQSQVLYNYYNLQDKEIKEDHTYEDGYPLARTSFSDYLIYKMTKDPVNYEFYRELYDALGMDYLTAENTAANQAQLVAMVQAALAQNKTSITLRYTDGKNVKQDVSKVMKSFTNIKKYSYTTSPIVRSPEANDVLLTLNFNPISPVSVQSVKLSDQTIDLAVGQTKTLKATITPSNASNKNVTWTTGNPNIAIVTDGVVRAIGIGSTTITVKTADGGKTAIATVNVSTAITSVTLNKGELTLDPGEDVALEVSIVPNGPRIKAVTWTSSNPKVATVDSSGRVHAVSGGTAVITVASALDKSVKDTCTVTVPIPVTGVQITPFSAVAYIGIPLTIKAKISPSNATNKDIIWSSSNLQVATVDSHGVVNPISEGMAVITALTSDGEHKASMVLSVCRSVTNVILSQSQLVMRLGYPDFRLQATVLPVDATIRDLSWTSSNPKVVTVDGLGNLHAVGYGTATITVTSKQDSKKSARCTVTVPSPVTGVTLGQNLLPVAVGKSVKLTATIWPTTATNKTLIWTTSDSTVAEVKPGGIVIGKGVGAARITVTTADGGYTASCTVVITK